VSLRELAASVREGRVSSRELVAESLARIDQHDGPVNAVVLIVPDEAAAAADAIDARVAAGEDPGPLAGLPLLVKDNEDTVGLPTTFGTRLWDPVAAERDCEVVGRLKAAGAVVVGKTNLPEFAFEGFTSNERFGDTRNPWALDWTPGGSSGGSSAALAMGLAPIATGTDGGGSVRIPASFCGLVGLKPTNGLIGRDPLPSWIDLSTKGPMTTSIEDASLLFDVMRGPAAGDPTALPAWSWREGAWPARILATPRMTDYGPLPEGIQASWEAALANLESATGLPIEPIAPPFPEQLDSDWLLMVGVEELAWIGRDVLHEGGDRIGAIARGYLEYSERTTADEYVAARRRRYGFVRMMDELLGADAILVSPTMPVEGFYADGRMPGKEEPGTDTASYNTQTANTTGHPALSVPAGVSANGVPFGLQITGPRFADDMVMAVGAAWEAANPWPLTAPSYDPFGV
jgi:Asp-tRNA(Asn)/Glu-tRNA(Gln) amidotransferase A subunit family amidase